MKRAPFPSWASNSAFVTCWPHPRPSATTIPHPTPRHERLIAALCPSRGFLPASVLPSLTWNDIRSLCTKE